MVAKPWTKACNLTGEHGGRSEMTPEMESLEVDQWQ